MNVHRFWEIDFLRGIAVVLMILFHFFWDLNFFGIFPQSLYIGLWGLLQKIIAVTFLLLVGICLTISCNKAKAEGRDYRKRFLERGVRVFGLGLVITAVTALAAGYGTIIFGILHLIGAAIILSIFFVRFRYINLVLGAMAIAIGSWMQAFSFPFPYLVWLGFMFPGFYTFDYYPLLPWFGVVLIGIFLGNVLYKGGKRCIGVGEKEAPKLAEPVQWLGRHSLAIYFIHQPVLIALLFVFQLFA